MQITIRKLMLFVLVVSVFCAICVALDQLLPESSRPRIALRNSGLQPLSNATITLTSPIDGKQQVIELASLAPNESADWKIEIYGDPKMKLEFEHQGNDIIYTNGYIDLWPSDTWLIEIGNDGSCDERYWTDRPTAKNAG